ncbi:MAG: hypothetical protein JNL21_04160 [Myxococcales bacterium]|nr:hypothetical protein [Myxococcales bacterium]
MKTRSNSPRAARLRIWLAALLSLVCALGSAPAWAGEPSPRDRDEAKRAYAEARKLTKEGKHAEALEKYRLAHDLAPTPVTRLDLARALAGQGKLLDAQALALSTAEMPVTATETQKSKTARKDAAELATALAARIPRVVVTLVDPASGTAGAAEPEVAVDGKPVSKELLGKELPVDPGDHVATARSGERATSSTFSILEGVRQNVELALPAPPEPEPPPIVPPFERPDPPPSKVVLPPPTTEPEEEGVHPVVPVLFTAGGVGLLLGVVTGSIAWSQAGDLQDGCPNNRCPAEWQDELALNRALTTTSTIGFVVGGVAVAAGGIGLAIDLATQSSGPAKVQARLHGTSLAVEATW